jgi:hypothetical protein
MESGQPLNAKAIGRTILTLSLNEAFWGRKQIQFRGRPFAKRQDHTLVLADHP